MPRFDDEQLRSIITDIAEEIQGLGSAPGRALTRARRRVARNLVAGALALTLGAYGSVALASRILERRAEPVRPNPGSITSGLWTMNDDGSDAIQVTGEADDDEPTWSPKGDAIAFTRWVGDNNELFLIEPDGSNPRRLTYTSAEEREPAWTNDGARIAFVRGEPDRPVIYSVARDGSDERRLVGGSAPSFSPNGKWLTFECPARGSGGTLCQTDAAGRGAPAVIDTGGRSASSPVWADDQTLVFTEAASAPRNVDRLVAKNVETNEFEPRPHWEGHWVRGLRAGRGPAGGVVYTIAGDVFAAPASGPDVERITFDPTVSDSHASWNPVTDRIVLRRVVDPPTAIFIAGTDGSNVRQLSEGRRVDGGAAMSPDGSTIAFASSRDGFAAIYLMDADGSNERRVTHETAGMIRPLWSPDGGLLYVVRMHPLSPLERGISVIAAGGGVATEILGPRVDLGVPSISVDGTRVAYVFEPSDDQRNLLVANADGSGERPLLFGWVDWPVWGAGDRIAYLDGPSTQRRLAIVNADGSGKRALGSVHPSTQGLWWGSGRDILFAANGDIYAADPGTGAIRAVVALPGNQYNPSWTPDGRILFNGEVPG